MKTWFGAAVCAAVAAALVMPAAQAAPQRAAGSGEYIVVLKDAVDTAAVASLHAKRYGVKIDITYSHAIHGYSAVIAKSQIPRLARDENVDFVEPDGLMYPTEQILPWGIDHVQADVSSTKAGDGEGSVDNVNVYVIDTGIDIDNPELNVVEHVDMVDPPNEDCNGHGTHVSGTIAARDNDSEVVGMAPGAPLHGVKVFNCTGPSPAHIIVKAVDWVTEHAVLPAVANMSLGGGTKRSLDVAIQNSVAKGVFYALAAGNEAQDACNVSPARAGNRRGIMTVGAIDVNHNEASFSNYGRCVDIWAPGVAIPSSKLGGGIATLSGTSMASPHVAGAAAIFLSQHPTAKPDFIEFRLKQFWIRPGTESKDGKAIKRVDVRHF